MKKSIVFFILVTLLTACGQQRDFGPAANSMTESAPVPQEVPTAKHTVTASTPDVKDNAKLLNRKIIKKADCKMEVENVESSTERIRHAVAIQGGFVASMNLSATDNQYQNNIVLRVPDENFESLFNDIGKEAISVDYKRITSDDVTEQFVDNESRLKTKKEVKNRYADILRGKAKTVEEVLDTEEKIRKIQEEIDVHEGRLQYLSHKVDLSTISLNIYQLKPKEVEPVVATIPSSPSIGDEFKASFMTGWNFVLGSCLFLFQFWPLWIGLSFLLFWKGKAIVKMVKEH